MSLRPTTLIFAGSSTFFPADLPLELWEVIADSNSTFEIEASGKLIRKDRLHGTRWFSTDLTGSFTVSNLPKHTAIENLYSINMVNGVARSMSAMVHGSRSPLLTCSWRWALDCMDVDLTAQAQADTYVGCMGLIKHAEANPGYKTGDRQIDGMIGMALCRIDLLANRTAREVLGQLTDHQLRAISSWPRALHGETSGL